MRCLQDHQAAEAQVGVAQGRPRREHVLGAPSHEDNVRVRLRSLPGWLHAQPAAAEMQHRSPEQPLVELDHGAGVEHLQQHGIGTDQGVASGRRRACELLVATLAAPGAAGYRLLRRRGRIEDALGRELLAEDAPRLQDPIAREVAR